MRRQTLFITIAVYCALDGFNGAWAAESDSAVAAIERLFRSGQSSQAFVRVERAILEQPNDPAVRFLRGVMLTEAKRESEAVVVFERLTQDFPELPEPYNNLAVLLAAQGQVDRSRDLLETALRNDPGYLTAQQNLGDVFARLAVRAYAAAANAKHVDEVLQRKLRMARELAEAGASRR